MIESYPDLDVSNLKDLAGTVAMWDYSYTTGSEHDRFESLIIKIEDVAVAIRRKTNIMSPVEWIVASPELYNCLSVLFPETWVFDGNKITTEEKVATQVACELTGNSITEYAGQFRNYKFYVNWSSNCTNYIFMGRGDLSGNNLPRSNYGSICILSFYV